jgi:Na+-driven multidrug efflux pump
VKRPVLEVAGDLWRISWPLVLNGQLMMILEMITIFWIGRLLGPDALAVEAIWRPIILAATWFFLAASGGASVLIARSVGARDEKGLTIGASAMALTVAIWVLVIILSWQFARPLAGSLVSGEIGVGPLLEYFIPWVYFALPAMVLLSMTIYVANATGWTRISLWIVAIQVLTAMPLVPWFIDTQEQGLAGAPLAHGSLSTLLTFAMLTALYLKREKLALGQRLHFREVLSWERWKAFLDIGLPPQIARMSIFLSQVFYVQLLVPDGAATVAGYGIAIFVFFMTMNVTASLSQGVCILMSMAFGAQALDRAKQTLNVGLGGAALVGGLLGAVLLLFSGGIAGLFTSSGEVIARFDESVGMMAWTLPISAVAQTYLAALASIKATKRAGSLSILADIAGVGFVVFWGGDTILQGVLWAIVLSQVVRAGAVATLANGILRRRLSH